MRIYSRRQREIEKEKEDEEKENCALSLSLSLSSAVRYKHSLAHARASEPLKKMSREEKETARFKILKLLQTLSLWYFSVT